MSHSPVPGAPRGGDPERGVPLLQPELLVPGGDLVRFELTEEHPEGGERRDTGSGGRSGGVRPAVDLGDAAGLGEQTLRFRHGVVATDQQAEGVRFVRSGVRRQRAVRSGDLEGSDLVVAVVEEFVVPLGRRGEGVEGFVDGRVVVPRAAFDRREVTVQCGFDRLGGGTYLGSGGLRSIRHGTHAIRSGPVPAQ